MCTPSGSEMEDRLNYDHCQDYNDAFSDGYSVGKREVLDMVHQINDTIKSKGFDNVSKEDMRFAIKTIVEYFSQ